MGQGNSFYCVDFNDTLRLSQLDECVAAGVTQIYLHLRRVRGDNPLHLPTNLMHSKVLLLDLQDGEAEIWVGSYNHTSRAWNGEVVQLNRSVSRGKALPDDWTCSLPACRWR